MCLSCQGKWRFMACSLSDAIKRAREQLPPLSTSAENRFSRARSLRSGTLSSLSRIRLVPAESFRQPPQGLGEHLIGDFGQGRRGGHVFKEALVGVSWHLPLPLAVRRVPSV